MMNESIAGGVDQVVRMRGCWNQGVVARGSRVIHAYLAWPAVDLKWLREIRDVYCWPEAKVTRKYHQTCGGPRVPGATGPECQGGTIRDM